MTEKKSQPKKASKKAGAKKSPETPGGLGARPTQQPDDNPVPPAESPYAE